MPTPSQRPRPRALRPLDYLLEPLLFGVSDNAAFHLPEQGDAVSQRAAVVQHRLVVLVRGRARPGTGPGAQLGRLLGFSRQHWSDCIAGRAWMRETTLLAADALLLGIVEQLEPPPDGGQLGYPRERATLTTRIWKMPGPTQVGQLAHSVIADLLFADAARAQPAWPQVLTAVDQRMARDGYRDRAARQTITAAALAYLTLAPPTPWQFLGAEVRRPGVRFDLLWLHPDTGAVMVDEVKTGHAGVVNRATRGQAERYLRALLDSHPATTSISVRAISTRAPMSSWTFTVHDLRPAVAGQRRTRPPP